MDINTDGDTETLKPHQTSHTQDKLLNNNKITQVSAANSAAKLTHSNDFTCVCVSFATLFTFSQESHEQLPDNVSSFNGMTAVM